MVGFLSGTFHSKGLSQIPLQSCTVSFANRVAIFPVIQPSSYREWPFAAGLGMIQSLFKFKIRNEFAIGQ